MELPAARVVLEAPWYAWVGGPRGATLVFSAIVIAPRLGVSAFVCAMIVGMLMVNRYSAPT